MNPVEVLRDGLALLDECPYRDAVDPGMHSGCEFCADREDERAALADVEALVQAARPFAKPFAIPPFHTTEKLNATRLALRDALRPFSSPESDSDKEPAA